MSKPLIPLSNELNEICVKGNSIGMNKKSMESLFQIDKNYTTTGT